MPSNKTLRFTVLGAAIACLALPAINANAGPNGCGSHPPYGFVPGYRPGVPPMYRHGMMPARMAPPYPAGPAAQGPSPHTPRQAEKAPMAADLVGISGMRFQPDDIRLKAGETLTWENRDPMPHAIISRGGDKLASGTLGRGARFEHTFDKPGTYQYYCSIHPSMAGTVIVE